ncbi:MAG: SGNH/GDSL hydrolase family protein [Calditrichaeota bacterium]|nr:SGNH/GDSL hydrolase family protein [Calditrichota bacterium]
MRKTESTTGFWKGRPSSLPLFLTLLAVVLACARPLASLGKGTHETVVSESGFIPPDDERVTITGAWFLRKSPERVVIDRFTEEVLRNDSTFINPVKARTQTGVCIYLATNSPRVTFLFEKRDSSAHRSCLYGVYRNGELYKEIPTSRENPVYSFTVVDPDSSGEHFTTWEVVLPHFFGVNFKGIRVAPGSRYRRVELPEKVYVAIGNSITHGAGQHASYQTYPFRLARAKGWVLYNLAVGGSKTSWPVATLLRGHRVDVVTVLWGHNDWTNGFTVDQERTYYRRLVEELLKAAPHAQIYCITPTFTYRKRPKKGNVTLDQIREVQTEVVRSFQARGFANLHLIQGVSISGPSLLRPRGSSRDGVHFTVEGAAKFAEQLARLVED